MLAALLGVEIVLVILVVLVLLRVSRQRTGTATPDARLQALLGADVPAGLAKAEARDEALERLVRGELAQARQEAVARALQGREAAEAHAAGLRREVLGALEALGRRLGDFGEVTHKHQHESREALYARLGTLSAMQTEQGERLRAVVEARLDRLNEANATKLEEMRATVDEKLHRTLQTRLTESFGAVTDQLSKVHTGLGEMSKLSADVGDLSRIFTNVKSRGGFAEVQLGMLLEQMLASSQFVRNAKVKPNTAEMVEYAVKLPTANGELLLPIDAKFPREAWERLETAYAEGAAEELGAAGKAFETAIRVEGKRICEKYIAPPATTNFAIMFLPTEGLYAEVMRRDGLQAGIQQSCRVTIAGPSTLSAILNSFQMGFHMLQLQQKGDEVWKVLGRTRAEFEKFEVLMSSMERQVGTVQNTLEKLNTRTRAINRSLRDVSLEETAGLAQDALSGGFNGVVPLLAAVEEGQGR